MGECLINRFIIEKLNVVQLATATNRTSYTYTITSSDATKYKIIIACISGVSSTGASVSGATTLVNSAVASNVSYASIRGACRMVIIKNFSSGSQIHCTGNGNGSFIIIGI